MITPAYAITATERVLPRLALDFTTGTLDPRVTVARALNTATRVNNSGFIEAVNADLPRFDYAPITLQPMGLLIEETRQNLLLQSENFNVSPWTKVTCSVSSDAIAGPDNTLSADKLIPDNGVTISATTVRQDITKAASALTYTMSVFGKAAEYDRLRIRCQDSGGSANRADVVVNISTGEIVTAAAVAGTFTNPSAKVTAYGNGFFRIQLTFTTGTDTFLRIQLIPLDSTATTGDGVKGVFIYGAQLELGAFATSYIPTTTVRLSRNADVVSMTGTNFSSWWVATNGAAAVRAQQSTTSGTRPWIQFDDNTSNNIIALRGNTTNPELYIKATTDQATIDAGTIAANTNYGASGAWNTNSCAAAINGATAVTDDSATIPAVTQARLGSDGTNYLNGWLQNIRYWPQRITNAEVQAFSKL